MQSLWQPFFFLFSGKGQWWRKAASIYIKMFGFRADPSHSDGPKSCNVWSKGQMKCDTQWHFKKKMQIASAWGADNHWDCSRCCGGGETSHPAVLMKTNSPKLLFVLGGNLPFVLVAASLPMQIAALDEWFHTQDRKGLTLPPPPPPLCCNPSNYCLFSRKNYLHLKSKWNDYIKSKYWFT